MKLVFFFSSICVLAAIELEVEKVDIEYFNPKYFTLVNLTMRRKSRSSPYIVNLWVDSKYPLGNNLSIKWSLYENIGGHFVLTPIHIEYGLCDFALKDEFIGKMIFEQLPKNVTCPIPAGLNKFENIEYCTNRLPYIPFTYLLVIIRQNLCSYSRIYQQQGLVNTLAFLCYTKTETSG